MTELIQFALLGLGAGAAYTLLGHGIVQIYKSSGIVNFAQAAFAMFGAYAFYQLRGAMPTALAFVAATLLTVALGVATFYLTMRPLRQASPLSRTISTLGILSILTAVGVMRYQSNVQPVAGLLPATTVHFGSVIVPQDRLWLTLIVIALTALLFAVYRFTSFGRATSAVAENELSAALLGWSTDLIACANWAIGAALAAIAGIFIGPLAGISVTGLTLLIVPALAAAALGSFQSFPVTLLGGLIIGILQSETSNYVHQAGWPDAVPFVVIMLVLTVRGRGLPLRSHVTDRLGALGTGRVRVVPALVATGVAIALVNVVSVDWVNDAIVSIVWAVMILSIVLLTGFAGQLSLAQFSLGGIGALIAARLVTAHFPFVLAAILAVAATVLVGALLGLPALRTRGVNLAVVTLGLGAAVESVLYSSPTYMDGADGTQIGPQSLFGIPIDGIFAPRTYAVLSIVILMLCSLVVANVRRGSVGRRLIAVRTNERAAAALGIGVTSAKLYAFGVAAAIAAIAGIMDAFRAYTVTYSDFSPVNSIAVMALAVVGGVAYIVGAPIGSLLAVGGIGTIVGTAIFGANQGELLALIGGAGLILTLILNPDGLARNSSASLARLGTRARRSQAQAPETAEVLVTTRVTPRSLEIQDVTVRFGGVIALRNVGLEVHPGEIAGLIGPNGAGKSTLIDSVTGFVRTDKGSAITLDGRRIDRLPAHRRARAGLSRSFQSLELFDDVTVLDNLRTACEPRVSWRWVTDLVWPRNRPLTPVALAAVREFGLEPHLHDQPENLSYGRRRLVAIARALAAGPSVLLLDEPAAGLDQHESAELGRLIRKLADEWGIGILIIEHDMAVVMAICDRVTVLDFGRVIASGSPTEIRQDPAVIAAYLGQAPAVLTDERDMATDERGR
jgi:ABC-type branched-subunit amino acid transport system ATPase component/branched-subunit amino acid ABC-type transport system permease component